MLILCNTYSSKIILNKPLKRKWFFPPKHKRLPYWGVCVCGFRDLNKHEYSNFTRLMMMGKPLRKFAKVHVFVTLCCTFSLSVIFSPHMQLLNFFSLSATFFLLSVVILSSQCNPPPPKSYFFPSPSFSMFEVSEYSRVYLLMKNGDLPVKRTHSHGHFTTITMFSWKRLLPKRYNRMDTHFLTRSIFITVSWHTGNENVLCNSSTWKGTDLKDCFKLDGA